MSQSVGGELAVMFSRVSLDVVARAAAILVGALEADDLMCETPRGKKLSSAENLEQSRINAA